jgi:hypothetical protein
VQSVSDHATPATWTAQVVTRGGRLPDLEAMHRAVRAVGEPFWLRGVEATIDGDLVEVDGRLALKVADGGPVLALAPLSHKVQWDPRLKQEAAATDTERAAYTRLAEPAGGKSRVRIVGPLVATDSGPLPLLEVRHFVWRTTRDGRKPSSPKNTKGHE